MTSCYIETEGSNHSFADAEQMAALLGQAKFQLKEKVEEADIVIMNACTTKGITAHSILQRIEAITSHYPYKLILITGCLAQAEAEKFKGFSVVGSHQIHHIVEAVEETLHNNIVKMLDPEEMPPLTLPRIRKNPIVEIIPIARNSVSLSKKNILHEKTRSYPQTEITMAVQKAVQEGVKEIVFAAHNTAAYGMDLGTDLTMLLQEVMALPGEFKIRLDHADPFQLIRYKEKLTTLLREEKMFKYLHLMMPTIEEMRRKESIKELTIFIQELKLAIPELTLVMDLTTCSPMETEEEQWDMLTMLRKTSPDMVNLHSFVPQPKTSTAKLPPLPSEVAAHRTKILTEVRQNIAKLQNERWKGWEGEVLVHEQGIAPGLWIARNKAYKAILIEGQFKVGDIVAVRISKVTIVELRGEVIKQG